MDTWVRISIHVVMDTVDIGHFAHFNSCCHGHGGCVFVIFNSWSDTVDIGHLPISIHVAMGTVDICHLPVSIHVVMDDRYYYICLSIHVVMDFW
jgi:hypothetical protein